jgi:prohibitin 2
LEILLSLFALVLLLGGIVLVIWGIIAALDEHTPGSPITILVGAILFLVGIGLSGIRIIPSGNVGVVITAGTVNAQERSPGINWVTPFIDDIRNFSTRVETYEFTDLAAASREYQDVFLTGVLNYHISPEGAAELFVTYNDDYVNKVVVPFFNDSVKETTAKYGIADILPKRDQIRQDAVDVLKAKLEPLGIFVDDIAFANVNFNQEYNLAIQNKQIQELQIQTERNILEQRKVQAEQAQAAAKGEADAAIERARGAAETVRIARSAEAEGNRVVAESLTTPILTQMAIDKFNPNVRIILMPPSDDGGSQFIFPPEILNEPVESPAP